MNLKSVEARNFMSFKDIAFKIESKGLTLIEGVNRDEGGSNAAGKSSLTDAISWCLFGKTVRGLKADEVINRSVGKNCAVMLEIEHGGHDYIVSRYRKDSKFQDRYMIYRGRQKIELGSLAATEEWTLNEFAIDPDLFRCTVLYSQGETFNFVDENNKAQKDILSKIMRLDYEQYFEKTKARLKEMIKQTDECNRQLTVLDSHLEPDIEAKFERLEKEWEETKQFKLDRILKNIKLFEDRLGAVEVPESEKIEKRLAFVKALIEKVGEGIDKLAKKDAEHGLLTRDTQRKIQKIKNEKPPEKCPECLQDWPEKIDEDELAEKLKSLAEERDAHMGVCHTVQRKLVDLNSDKKKLQEEANELEVQFRGIKAKKAEVVDLKRSIKSFEDDYAELKHDVNPHTVAKDAAIEKQKQIIEKALKIKATLESLEEEAKLVGFWHEAFGDAGIKSFVFDLVCSSLTVKANKYLDLMTSGSIAINFDTQKKTKAGDIKEKFDCSIITNGQTIPYAAYSGGEKRRISLATDMALSEIMTEYYDSNFNFMVFDEQSNYLDAQGKKQFLTLLKELASTKKVFVVDHDSEFKAMFDDVLTVEKKEGVSRIL